MRIRVLIYQRSPDGADEHLIMLKSIATSIILSRGILNKNTDRYTHKY